MRRLAPLTVLIVPLVVVAAIVAVDAARVAGDNHDTAPRLLPDRAAALPRVSAPPPARTPTPTPTAAGCPRSGLSVTTGVQDAAMGLRVLQILAVNCGTVPRTLHGHPAIRVLDEDRQPLDVLARPGSSGVSSVPSFDVAPRTVTLEPGERASSAVLWRNLVTDPSVRATSGHFLEVTVFAGDAPQVVPADGGIDLGNTVKVGIAPWTASG
jgi:hypothetical protein